MIHIATQADAAAIDGFLANHAETSMFLRSNLAAHGVGHGDNDRSTEYFLWPDARRIEAVFGLSKAGYLMVQAPDAPPAAYQAFARAIEGRLVIGMTGVPEQVERTFAACGVSGGEPRDEPLFALSLCDLPDPGVLIRRAGAGDIPMLAQWWETYMVETETAPPEGARQSAKHRAVAATGASEVRLLIEDGNPVAMASLNASSGDMVQVGGVFTPPENRNRGLGRSVTAARLIEARDEGANRAILFAASLAAAKVYRSIGFKHIGEYRLSLLAAAQVVTP